MTLNRTFEDRTPCDRIGLWPAEFRGASDRGDIGLEGEGGKLGERRGLSSSVKLMFNVVTP